MENTQVITPWTMLELISPVLVGIWFIVMVCTFSFSSFVVSLVFFLLVAEFIGGITNASVLFVVLFTLDKITHLFGFPW
jgi:hypothetical protein